MKEKEELQSELDDLIRRTSRKGKISTSYSTARILLVTLRALKAAELSDLDIHRLGMKEREKKLSSALVEVFKREDLSGFGGPIEW